METAPSNEVDKSLILKDVNAVKVAMNGVYSTMYNRIDFVTANAHQCFGNMAVTLCAEVMGDDMIQTAQGPGWFWKDYNYEARVRYTSKIWRSYFTWKYFLRDHQQRQLYSIGRAHRRGRRERIEMRHGAGLCRPGVRLLHADPVVPADL